MFRVKSGLQGVAAARNNTSRLPAGTRGERGQPVWGGASLFGAGPVSGPAQVPAHLAAAGLAEFCASPAQGRCSGAQRLQHRTPSSRWVLHRVAQSKPVITMAFASWWYKTHVYEKDSGSPSRSGEKKGADEKKATSRESRQPSRTRAGGGTLATKVSTSSPSTSKSSSMNTTENKAVKSDLKRSHNQLSHLCLLTERN